MRINSKSKRIFAFVMAMMLIVCQFGEAFASSKPGETALVINLGPDNATFTQKLDTLPFNFKVANSGVYMIEYDETKNEITFIYKQALKYQDDGKTSQKVNRADTNSLKPQLGVVMHYDENKVTTKFEITEHSTYVVDNETGALGLALKNGNAFTSQRSLLIGNYTDGDNNQYVFISPANTREEVDKVFVPMGYAQAGYSNSKITYDNSDGIVFGPRTMNVLESKETLIGGSIVDITYTFSGLSQNELDDKNSVSSIEELISRLFMSLGDVLFINVFQNIFGKNLSIDTLVFNKYEQTKIDLYNGAGGTNINNVVRNVVNKWFKILSYFVYVCFVIILIYIGIMGMVSAGSEKQDKIKGYLSNWITGLLILLTVPTFALKYIIALNDAFVAYVADKASPVKSYYNSYTPGENNEIQGSDSATVSVNDLYKAREKAIESRREIEEKIEAKRNDIRDDIQYGTRHFLDIFGWGTYLTETETHVIDALVEVIEKNTKKEELENTENDELRKICSNRIIMFLSQEENLGKTRDEVLEAIRDVLLDDKNMVEDDIWEDIKELQRLRIELDELIEKINENIEIVENDLMGTMRVQAGETRRMIFVFVWYVLFFQLISLAILYFKRIFIIGILITIFPLIALFYCIDKMADNSSQTLKLWFKEFLSNVFVQSIHAVMYIVLVEMGLNIYKADHSNWVWFVAAVLMLIPAEGMLRAIFGLDGSTVNKLKSSAMGALAVAGAGYALIKAKSSRKAKNKARLAKIQKSQDKADLKASIRDNRRIRSISTEEKRVGGVLVSSKTTVEKDPIKGFGKVREAAYQVASRARNVAAKNVGKIGVATDVIRGTAAVAATTAYMASEGFSGESVVMGVNIAKSVSGRTENKLSKEDLKYELSGAWARKHEAEEAKK